jgi:hypothetical protein
VSAWLFKCAVFFTSAIKGNASKIPI